MKGAAMGVTHMLHCCQPIHGGLWGPDPQYIAKPPRFWKRHVGDTFVIKNRPKRSVSGVYPWTLISSLQQKRLGQMDPCPFLIPQLHMNKRLKKHLKTPYPIYEHCNITGHYTIMDSLSTVGRESQNLTRTIKEAMFKRVNDPSLNRSIGKYQLPHIWD